MLSLFSGVGGFDMGLENAGMETVFQCEWDKHCRTILDRHWPTVPKWDDVSTLTGEHILAHAPVIDVVAWGSPCQDLSVAGKRAGLEGGRSGLFYEGIRIITELRKASNGRYPRISIWENVYGALNSNKGEDFEAILKEMVEAGSLLCEWRVLDAQYFGIPQRRRRVFVVAVFDSATAARCPDPLLPVSEGLRWHPTTRTETRENITDTVTGSIGSGREIANSITAELYHHGSVVNQDANNGHVVIEPSIVGSLAARDYKGVGNQYVNEGKVIVESMLLDPTRVGDVRVYEPPVQTLQERMGTGGNTVPMVIQNPILFDDDRRVGPRIFENTVKTLQAFMGTGGNNTPMVAQEPLVFQPGTMVRLNGGVWDGVVPTLRAEAKRGDNEPHITYSIQDGREIEKNQNGLGVAEEGAPAYTIDQTGAQAVAIPIDTRNALRDPNKYDAQNRQGLGIGADGDPMATLTPAHVNAVAYGIQGNMIGRQDHNGPAGKGHTDEGDPMFTLNTTDKHAVATTMVVRRLTPLECERLMGWPDNHTRYKADGTEQADTHRYKQCGNGVASPVAQWIGEQLINL